MALALNLCCVLSLPALAQEPGAPVPSVEIPECDTTNAPDTDRDGLTDDCEIAVARAFAPILAVRSGGCNRDTATGRPGGGYLHLVQPASPGSDTMRIGYLPAYFHDCGWRGAKCSLPMVDCSSHAGDSEIIVIELSGYSTMWQVSGVFLSAHCYGRSGGSCRWYRGPDLREFDWVDAAPIIWVSEGRNANYPSWSTCDSGHYSLDTCDHHDVSYRFPIDRDRNLGSAAVPAFRQGCVSGSDVGSEHVDPTAVECFLDPNVPFRGWQATGPGATSYATYLKEMLGF